VWSGYVVCNVVNREEMYNGQNKQSAWTQHQLGTTAYQRPFKNCSFRQPGFHSQGGREVYLILPFNSTYLAACLEQCVHGVNRVWSPYNQQRQVEQTHAEQGKEGG